MAENQPQEPVATETPTAFPTIVYSNEEQVQNAVNSLFKNMSDYMIGELQANNEDFKLLETMNNATKDKYLEMTEVTRHLSTFMGDLQKRYKDFEPYLKKIEQIDGSLGELEQTVTVLDDYTKRLDEKFKKLAAQKREASKRITKN